MDEFAIYWKGMRSNIPADRHDPDDWTVPILGHQVDIPS